MTVERNPRPTSIAIRRSRHPLSAAATVALFLTGCIDVEGPLSTLHPAGPASEPIARIWWIMLWSSLAILLTVVLLALYATYRDPEWRARIPPHLLIVGGGVVFPFTTLLALLIYGMQAGHALLPLSEDDQGFRVEVRGHQWWWEIRYPDIDGGTAYTANELHIPAGRPVDVHVSTEDVIHSFWVPRLGGKIDALPGRTTVIRLEAWEPGVLHGLCAEFCGAQHARMGLHVEVHDEDGLTERLSLLARAGEEPPRQELLPGQAAFEQHCAACHSRDARERGAGIGPNLADLPHRATLGAGTLLNTEANLLRWLLDHETLKPGNRMPSHRHLDVETLQQIVDYLSERR